MAAKKPLGLYAGDVEGFSDGDFVDIAFGGTGAVNKLIGFNNLSPLTSKGDVIVSNGIDNIKQAIGADSTVLTADSSLPSGLKWAMPTVTAGGTTTSSSFGGRGFLLMGA